MCSPDQPPCTWERTFPNRTPELMRALDELDDFLQVHNIAPRAGYTARLAVEEMGTNIIKYGYDDANEHEIVLRASVTPDSFRLELIDDGHEFDPTTRAEPANDQSLDEREPGGWGIALVRRLARSVDYKRQGDRNILAVTIDRQADRENG